MRSLGLIYKRKRSYLLEVNDECGRKASKCTIVYYYEERAGIPVHKKSPQEDVQ